MKPMSFLAAAILALIVLAHLVRLALRVPVTVGGAQVPMWMSGAAAVALGALAVLLVREQRRR